MQLRIMGLSLLNAYLLSNAAAQSTFQFQNYNEFYGIDAPVFDADGAPLFGPNYLVELWGAATPDSLEPLVVFSFGEPRYIQPFIFPAYFQGTTGFLAVMSVGPGDWAYLQARAWDATLGSTYEEVLARNLGGYGESQIFYAQGGSPLGLPTLPGPLIGLESFSLRAVVPEPGAVWLVLAGLPGLLWWARRRS